jgi:hypothetical protein
METIWEFLKSPSPVLSKYDRRPIPWWSLILGPAVTILMLSIFALLEKKMPWWMAYIFAILFLATVATIFAR